MKTLLTHDAWYKDCNTYFIEVTDDFKELTDSIADIDYINDGFQIRFSVSGQVCNFTFIITENFDRLGVVDEDYADTVQIIALNHFSGQVITRRTDESMEEVEINKILHELIEDAK